MYGTTREIWYNWGRAVWYKGIWHNHLNMVQLGSGVGMLQPEGYGTTSGIWYSQRDIAQLGRYGTVREI